MSIHKGPLYFINFIFRFFYQEFWKHRAVPSTYLYLNMYIFFIFYFIYIILSLEEFQIHQLIKQTFRKYIVLTWKIMYNTYPLQVLLSVNVLWEIKILEHPEKFVQHMEMTRHTIIKVLQYFNTWNYRLISSSDIILPYTTYTYV